MQRINTKHNMKYVRDALVEFDTSNLIARIHVVTERGLNNEERVFHTRGFSYSSHLCGRATA